MRAREILSEAARNLTTGTTRALTFALTLAAVLFITVGMDQAAVTATRIDHHQFRADGSTIWTIASTGGIDPGRCEALGGLTGVVGAGAVRSNENVRLALLPSTTTRLSEVTPGVAAILGIPTTATSGVWMPPGLASALSADPGEVLTFTDGTEVTIAHRYSLAVDATSLSSALAVPAPVTGTWDECWIDVDWYSESTVAALHFSLTHTPDSSSDQARIGQITSANGRSHNLSELLAARPTGWLLLAAPLLAGFVGVAAVRSRRLEMSAARHAGVSRTDLAAMTALETSTWAGAGAALTIAASGFAHVGLMAAAGMDPRTDLATTLTETAASATLVAAVTVFATALASLTNRPGLLYRYFRERQ